MNMFELRTAYREGRLTKQQYIQEMHRCHTVLHEYAAFMRDTDVAEIAITAEQVVMTLKGTGIKLVCDPADERIIPIEILNLGTFEKTELDFVKRMLGPRATIWDIGANVGWYSINLAKVFPQAQILAFEPIPSTFKQLEKNLALNQVSNVRTHHFGFSDKPGNLTFYFYPECSGNASTANLSEKASVRTLQCPVKTIDAFAAENSYAMDLIKCDVEGAELFVFQGGLKTIARHRPVVFTEMLRKWSAKFNYHPNDIIKLFVGIGYRCFAASGDKLAEFSSMDENTTETNFFFLHPEKHAALLKTLV